MGLAKVMLYKLLTQEPKRDIDDFRLKDGVLETIDKSFYVETGEKVKFNIVTKEVRIK